MNATVNLYTDDLYMNASIDVEESYMDDLYANATDGYYDDTYTDDLFKEYPLFNPNTVALVPKIPALLSMIASYIVIRECVGDLRAYKSTPRASYGRKSSGGVNSPPLARILLAMSVADLFFSFPWFMTTWMAPADIEDNGWLPHAVGNTATCTLQGTIFSFGVVSVPMFSVMYTFFSLMMVRYQWRDHRLIKLEPWLHVAIWLTAAAVAIFPIPLEMYNASESICWLHAHPYECKDQFRYGEEADCTRGDSAAIPAWIWHIVFTVFPAWLCFFVSIVLMAMIHHTVRHLEDRVSKYAGSTINRSRASSTARESTAARDSTVQQRDSGPTPNDQIIAKNIQQQQDTPAINRSKSEAVAWRALWLALAFLFTYFLDTLAVLLWNIGEIWAPALDFFAYMVYPLQGFMNLIIFLRGRQEMKTPEGRLVRRMLYCLEGGRPFHGCGRCCRSNQQKTPATGSQQQTRQETQQDSTH